MGRVPIPKPLFDDVETLLESGKLSYLTPAQNRDYHQACQFLLCYRNNTMTFTAYRREIERFLQWCLLKLDKSLKQLRREDIERYIKFCLKPPKSWISTKKIARYKKQNGKRIPNSEWRPFVATLSKAQMMIKAGEKSRPIFQKNKIQFFLRYVLTWCHCTGGDADGFDMI